MNKYLSIKWYKRITFFLHEQKEQMRNESKNNKFVFNCFFFFFKTEKNMWKCEIIISCEKFKNKMRKKIKISQ